MANVQIDKLAVTAGSMLFVDGLLLLVSPGRYASIRKAAWMPKPVNRTFDWLAQHDRARPIGLVLTALGFQLLMFGLFQQQPAD